MEVFFALLVGAAVLLLPVVLAVVALVKTSRIAQLQRTIEEVKNSLLMTQKAVAELHNRLASPPSGAPARVSKRRPASPAYAATEEAADQPPPSASPDLVEPAPETTAELTAEEPVVSSAEQPELAPETGAELPAEEPVVSSAEQPELASETGAELPAEEPVVNSAEQPELAPETGAEPTPTPELVPEMTASEPTAGAAPEATPEPPEPASALTAPESTPEPPEPAPADARAAAATSLEEMLAGNIFLKLGVVFVVIGVASLLGTAILSFGPLGKVIVGYAIGGAMLGIGFFAERRSRYRTIGRAVLAGAWGVLYFVTFAMHFIPQARVVESELLGIVALLIAAAGAVVFSLRYNSEWTTSFAFLLIYTTLGLAAWKLEANFNLAATTILAAGLAFLVWRRNWDRLLTFGIALTWVVFAAWIVPAVARPGTLVRDPVAEPVSLPTLLVPLAVTWAGFQAAVLWRHRRTQPRQTWLVAGYLANTAGGFGLMMFLVQVFAPARTWLAAAAFGVLYILGAWAFKARQRRVLYLISGTIGLLALALVAPLRLGFDSHWVPMSRMLGLEVVLAAGVFLRERYFRFLAYLAFAFTFHIDLLMLKVGGGNLEIAGAELGSRVPLFTLAVLLGLTNVFLLRRPWRAALTKAELRTAPIFFSVSAALLLLVLVWLEVPEALVAPAIVVAALCGLVVARFYALRDFAVEAALFAVAALVAVVVFNLDGGSTVEDQMWRVATLATCTGLQYAGYALARWRGPIPEPFRRWLVFVAVVFSVTAGTVLTLLILYDAPSVWVAPALAAWVAVGFALSLRYDLPELLYEGLAATLVAITAILAVAWRLDDRFLGLPERLVSVALALAALIVAEQLLERHLRRRQNEMSAKRRGFHQALTIVYLAVPTLLLCGLVKTEALAWDKNLLVALIWGVAALVYLEVARSRASPLWLAHGHLLMAAAVVHLFLVNFVQLGGVGPFSLRLVTVVPFLGFLLYAYNTWKDTTRPIPLDERLHELRFAYLYASVAVAATLVAYELWRAWVIVAWGVLAVLLLLRWRQSGNTHWRLSALGLGIASVARAIGVNLTYRDEIAHFRVNLVTVPLAALALLGGYLIIRLAELSALSAGDGGTDGQRLRDVVRRHRMVWLVLLVGLVTAFVWVETSGPIFTICLSLEGLGLIGLGIAVRERWSRLAGLLTLAVCVIKLFVDLFGMEGVPGWVPFLGVGVVLLAVAFGYTRFRSRLKELIE